MTRSGGTTSSPRSTGKAEKLSHAPRRASSRRGHERLPLRDVHSPRSRGGTKYGREPHPSPPGRPATPCEIGSRAGAPVQPPFRIARILHFFEPIPLVGPGRAIEVPRLVEVPIEPSPDVLRKALLENRACATPTDGFPQSGVDVVPPDRRVARGGIRTKRRRTRRAGVALVLLAAHVSRSRRCLLRKLIAPPRTDCTTFRSPMSHGPSCSIKPTVHGT